ncbi:hypothetical protein [Flavobacterium sp.]|uniref:hypothetical protein n=1 Tax=Flavobacterium sp. TaxID=239 RepID=UPI0008AC82D4|nr:hypothetical protein [Flavobacterium sp.]OGS60823.1 MAG: hypothetical protein A2X07_01815 [Flavobacteria bacterium GWF1_32_7]HBD26354.1 hypothetical protein [Flavobacterium sp.]
MKEEREKKSYSTFLKENEGKIMLAITIIFISLIMIYSNINEKEYYKKINHFQGKTVGKVYSIRLGKSSYLKYYFHDNDKKYYSEARYSEYTFDNFGKYYRVIFNEKKPSENHIYLNKEIQPDSITLTKAGFKYVIYYDYDIPTNTYIKKHKWE